MPLANSNLNVAEIRKLAIEIRNTVLELRNARLAPASVDALPVLNNNRFTSLATHDNSMLSSFNRCPRLYEILYRRRRSPRGKNAALSFGSLVHTGLEVWHKTNNIEAALEAVLTAPFDEPLDDFRTRGRALLLLPEYVNHYGNKEQKWGLKTIFTETAFDVEDPKDGMPYGGKIDWLVEWRGKLYIVDHKTTSRFDPTFSKFVPDTQTAGYIWAASLLHGKQVQGVIMNMIIVHKVKKPAEQQFQRKAFDYPQFYIDEWKLQVEAAYKEIETCDKTNLFRPRWQSCVNEYGRCVAYDLCRSDPINRENILMNQWGEYKWDWRDIEDKA